ncbi:unnamed protein product, partial [marine sediment metagenome]
DINPAAIGLALENLKFSPPKALYEVYTINEPEVSEGDARDLSDISSNSIDLICAHPPYAGIINYSSNVLSYVYLVTFAEGKRIGKERIRSSR